MEKILERRLQALSCIKIMKILEYLTPERVKLHLTGETKKEIIKEMAQFICGKWSA